MTTNGSPAYYQFFTVDPRHDVATDDYIAQKRAWVLSIAREFEEWEGFEAFFYMLSGLPSTLQCPCELVRNEADLTGCTQARRADCLAHGYGGYPFPTRMFRKMSEELRWSDHMFLKALSDRKGLHAAMQSTPTPPQAYGIGGRSAPRGCEALEASFVSRLWAAEMQEEAFPFELQRRESQPSE